MTSFTKVSIHGGGKTAKHGCLFGSDQLFTLRQDPVSFADHYVAVISWIQAYLSDKVGQVYKMK